MAADFDLDGHTDLYVTTAGYNVATDGYDALLWNDGDGILHGGRAGGRDQRASAGMPARPSETSMVTDSRICSSSGYTDPNWPIPRSSAGFPTNHHAERDLLYLNQGLGAERPPDVPRGRQGGRPRAQAARPRARRDLHRLRPRRAARPVRGQRRRPESAVRERRTSGTTRLPLRGGGAARRRRRPECRNGDRVRGLQPGRRADLLVTNSREQLHAAYRSRSRRARPRVHRRPPGGLVSVRHAVDGLGRVVGGPEPRRRHRSRRRQRRDPGA